MSILRPYRKFCESVAQFKPEDRDDYLALGIMSEIGELAALYKRQLRDGTIIHDDTLKNELGDILWYAVMLMPEDFDWEDFEANDFKYAIDEKDTVQETIEAMMHHFVTEENTLNIICIIDQAFKPFDLAAIIEANTAKLKSRAERGTLKGSGDNR